MFTTVVDHPKLLLTIGDLVDTASCQSYKTGSVVETLPAYVIDGNIKAVLSFVIPVYERDGELWLACKSGEVKVKSFDPARLKLVVEYGEKEKEFDLTMAHRLHILRLGASADGTPALLVERGYIQSHPVEKEIETCVRRLIEQYRGSIGAIEAKTGVEFPASRNPCGVYSDSCGGVKMGRYRL